MFYSFDIDISNRGLIKIPVKFGTVKGSFYCRGNYFATLQNAPENVIGSFDCSNNTLLSLDYSPKTIKDLFDCSGNQLDSLDGVTKNVGSFNCSNNMRVFTIEEVKVVVNVKGKITV